MRIKKIKHFFKGKRALLLIIVIVLLGIMITWLAEDSIRESPCEVNKFITAISNLLIDGQDGKCATSANHLDIMDFFYPIWGMSITLVLFLVELGGTYWYGVTLKKIIRLSLNGKLLAVGVFLYVFLYPIVYIFIARNKRIAGIWCIFCTFLAFCGVLGYTFYKTRKSQIKKLLHTSTVNQLWKEIYSKDEAGKNEPLQPIVEGLPIVDMIKHINYSDTEDVSEMIETMEAMMTGKNDMVSLIEGTEYAHSVIVVWTECIIESSGLHTTIEREKTAYILKKFWERIGDAACSHKDGERIATAYAVEILLPLIKLGTEEAAEVFYALWKNMLVRQDEILLYLILYEEYLHVNRCQWRENHCITVDTLEKDQKSLISAADAWKSELAWEFWRSWIRLKESGRDLGLTMFFAFCDDVERIKRGQTEGIQTHILSRYCWKAGKIR